MVDTICACRQRIIGSGCAEATPQSAGVKVPVQFHVSRPFTCWYHRHSVSSVALLTYGGFLQVIGVPLNHPPIYRWVFSHEITYIIIQLWGWHHGLGYGPYVDVSPVVHLIPSTLSTVPDMCMAMKQWLLGVFRIFGGRKWKELLDISVTFSSCWQYGFGSKLLPHTLDA